MAKFRFEKVALKKNCGYIFILASPRWGCTTRINRHELSTHMWPVWHWRAGSRSGQKSKVEAPPLLINAGFDKGPGCPPPKRLDTTGSRATWHIHRIFCQRGSSCCWNEKHPPPSPLSPVAMSSGGSSSSLLGSRLGTLVTEEPMLESRE